MLPDLRFAVGAVLAAALLVVTALGVAATLRLAQQAKLGPIEPSHGLAYADQSAWTQFNDPPASKRSVDFEQPVEGGDSVPISDAAPAGMPTPLASLPTPDLTTPALAGPVGTDLPGAGAPPALPTILDPLLATAGVAAATEPVASVTPEIGAAATPEPGHLAADVPPEATPAAAAAAAAPILARPVAQVADSPAGPAPEAIPTATGVPGSVAPTDHAIGPTPVATNEPAPAAAPSAVARSTIVALTIAPSATTATTDVVPTAPVAPTLDPAAPVESIPVAPSTVVPAPAFTETAFTETAATASEPVAPGGVDEGSTEIDQTATLPAALTGDRAAFEPAPPLPRVKPIRRLVNKVASPARRVGSRPSSVHRARTSRVSQAAPRRVRQAQTPVLTTNFTAATAQPNGLFAPFAAVKQAAKRFGNTPARNAAPNE
jgi:hypothetical protein